MWKKLIVAVLFVYVVAGCYRCGGGDRDNGDGDSSTLSWPQVSLTKVISGLSQPTHITHAGDGSGRLFVVERSGYIRIIKNGTLITTAFLNISSRIRDSGREQGLLSVAFPPDYANKGYFYVNYTSTNGNGDTVVARYHITTNADLADPSTEEILLTVDQPFSNHNGGQLAFGQDGYLYIGMGDGGSGGDPLNNAQSPNTLLGKILRIDVESDPGSDPYVIPPDNPFTQNLDYFDEIWALGLRNPWRFSFDRRTGDLFIADVGQNSYEEIDFQPSSSTGGENYGWNIMEGVHCFNTATCNQSGLVLPVLEYDQSQGDCSITGGMVSRSQDQPNIEGIYFYGDFCSGRIWGLRKNGTTWENSLLLDTQYLISTFGENEEGNLFLADYTNGDIYKITTP
jgi:glucose/arabinose dehydrogenase